MRSIALNRLVVFFTIVVFKTLLIPLQSRELFLVAFDFDFNLLFLGIGGFLVILFELLNFLISLGSSASFISAIA